MRDREPLPLYRRASPQPALQQVEPSSVDVASTNEPRMVCPTDLLLRPVGLSFSQFEFWPLLCRLRHLLLTCCVDVDGKAVLLALLVTSGGSFL